MKIEITIECDDIQDVKSHLSVIRSRILHELKIAEKRQPDEAIEFEDDNCYGGHEVKITL